MDFSTDPATRHSKQGLSRRLQQANVNLRSRVDVSNGDECSHGTHRECEEAQTSTLTVCTRFCICRVLKHISFRPILPWQGLLAPME